MKTTSLLSFLLLTTILFSCKKDEPVADVQPGFGFSMYNKDYKWTFVPTAYDANGNNQTGAYLVKTISYNTNNTMFILFVLNIEQQTTIECAIYAPTLEAKTYRSVPVLSDPWLESHCSIYGTNYGVGIDEYMEVTITNISGKYASGTFKALVHDVNHITTPPTEIVNGYFDKVLLPE